MSIQIRGNWLFVRQGEPHYFVASNYTNYLELGSRGETEYYLEARIEGGEFLVDADLPYPDSNEVCRIRDNFPETDCEKERTGDGYQILTPEEEPFFGIRRVRENRCLIRGTVYDGEGEIVAEENGEDFLVHRGPAVLGKSGQARGIVIGD